jgi:hypothetical protein
MAIRNLILTRENNERAFEELQQQWQEMAGVVNDVLNEFTVTRSGKVYSDTDIGIDSSAVGLILKSPDGHYWRVKVSNAGALTTTDLGTTKP